MGGLFPCICRDTGPIWMRPAYHHYSRCKLETKNKSECSSVDRVYPCGWITYRIPIDKGPGKLLSIEEFQQWRLFQNVTVKPMVKFQSPEVAYAIAVYYVTQKNMEGFSWVVWHEDDGKTDISRCGVCCGQLHLPCMSAMHDIMAKQMFLFRYAAESSDSQVLGVFVSSVVL